MRPAALRGEEPDDREGFAVSCEHCGAPHAVVLGQAVRRCRRCAHPAPLGASALAALERATAQVFRLAAGEHRRRVRRKNEVEFIALVGPLVFVPCWALFGGVALGAALSSVKDATIREILVAPYSAPSHDDRVAAFWLCWVAIAGVGLTLSTYLVGLAWARSVGALPRAIPPIEGGPARCHLCGAGLGAGGAVRGCRSCGATNVIRGRALDGAARDLGEQLARLSTDEARQLEAVAVKVPNFSLFCALFPLLLLAAYPVAGSFGRTRPDLLWVAFACSAPALVALAVTLFQPGLRARKLADTRPGDEVRVRGALHRVWGTYVETHEVGPLVLLAPEGANEPTLGLHFHESAGDGETTARVLVPGGEPLGAEPTPLSSLTIRTASGEWRGGRSIGEPQRIFADGARAGARPRWTVRAEQVATLDVFVV